MSRYAIIARCSRGRTVANLRHCIEAIWDKRFKSTYEKVQKKRERGSLAFSFAPSKARELTLNYLGADHLQKSMKEEATRITKRMKEVNKKHEGPSALSSPNGSSLDSPPVMTDSPAPFEQDVHGIWDLRGEKPPPSSIAARKDTLEARQLARVLDEHYSKLNALNVWIEVSRPFATQASASMLTFTLSLSKRSMISPHAPCRLATRLPKMHKKERLSQGRRSMWRWCHRTSS